MEKDNNNWILTILVVLLILAWSKQHKAKVEIARLHSQVSSYEDKLEEANSNIEDAQSYAWSSYDDMGYALDNLETVN